MSRKGSWCLPYTSPDLVAAIRLEEAGAATVMPLASPIGSGQGVQDWVSIRRIVNAVTVPVVVDAGIGTASDAALAMELGASAVLVNTAIARATNPVAMATGRCARDGGGTAGMAGRADAAQRDGARLEPDGRRTAGRGRRSASSNRSSGILGGWNDWPEHGIHQEDPVPKSTVTVPHSSARKRRSNRIKGILVQAKEQYGDRISDLQENWTTDGGTFSFRAMGFKISGSLAVTDRDVQITGDYPFAAIPFKGTIEATLRERAERLLASPGRISHEDPHGRLPGGLTSLGRESPLHSDAGHDRHDEERKTEEKAERRQAEAREARPEPVPEPAPEPITSSTP